LTNRIEPSPCMTLTPRVARTTCSSGSRSDKRLVGASCFASCLVPPETACG
jgi:hypothetical protein